MPYLSKPPVRMNEPNDNPFHDWVRQTLHGYRPDYDAHDWAALQRTLRRRRWWRRGALGGIGLLIVVVVGWLLTSPVPFKPKLLPAVPHPTANRITDKPAPTLPQPAQISRPLRPRIRRMSAVPTPQNRPVAESISSLPTQTQLGLLSTNLTATIRSNDPVAFSPEEIAIRQQMLTGDFGSDSTS